VIERYVLSNAQQREKKMIVTILTRGDPDAGKSPASVEIDWPDLEYVIRDDYEYREVVRSVLIVGFSELLDGTVIVVFEDEAILTEEEEKCLPENPINPPAF